MGNCQQCKNNICELDGEAIPDGFGGYEGNSEYVNYCSKGKTKEYESGGNNCKRFKEIEGKCTCCKKIFPISSLTDGFCTNSCRKSYVKHVTTCVERDAMIVNELQAKDKLTIDEMTSLNGATYYLEEGLSILKSLKVEMAIIT